MTSSPVPAVGYVRVSMMREEAISPELQRSAIEAKAARDGAAITEWIEELDVSGRGFGRKGVLRAIGLVEAGSAAAIYVWKYSRFGRNATLTGVHAGRVEEAGGRLVSATEDVDAATAVGKFTRGMLWEIDEFYSNVLGEQWQQVHAKRRRDGLPHDGPSRFGYLYHHASTERRPCPQGCKPGGCVTGYVPDPETAGAAAWMFGAYNSGTSVLKIAVDLNGRGLRATGRGPGGDKPWNQRQVRRFMDSGFPAGLLQAHDPACSCSKPQGCAKKVPAAGAHEPLISAGVWEEYLRQRKSRTLLPPRVEHPVYPLSGLVRCGLCGAPLNAHGQTYPSSGYKRGYMYQCARYKTSRECAGTWIARYRVEAVVHGWLHVVSDDVSEAAKAERGRVRARQASAGARRRLSAEAARCESALTALTVRLAEGLVPADAYAAARDELLAKRATAGAALEKLGADDDRLAAPPVRVAAGLARDWPTLPPGALRAVLGHLIDRIEVTSGGKGHAVVKIVAAWGETYLYDA